MKNRHLRYSIFIIVASLVTLELLLQLLTPRFFLKINYSLEKCENPKLRIIALGESTTAPRHHNKIDTSWPSQLETMLTESLQTCVAVYNFGIPGIETYQLVNLLKEYGDFIQPHFIITMMGINDGEMVFKPAEKWWSSFKILRILNWTSFEIKALIEKKVNLHNSIKLNQQDYTRLKELLLNQESTSLTFDQLISLAEMCYKEGVEHSKKEAFRCANLAYYQAQAKDGISPQLKDALIEKTLSSAHNTDDCALIEKSVNLVIKNNINLSPKESSKISRHVSRCLTLSSDEVRKYIETNFGDQSNDNTSAEKTYMNYQAVYEWAKNHGSKVITMAYPTQKIETLVHFLTTRGSQYYSYSSYTQKSIEVENYSSNVSDCLIDNHSYFEKQPGLKEAFLKDQFHMKTIGHTWIAQNILNSLEQCQLKIEH